jgi:hypothetical protein
MKRCKELKKDMHMIFINLEKDYDKILRNVIVIDFAEAQSVIKIHYPR